MEICVNDYIRTNKGYIWKIDKIDKCKICGQKEYIHKEIIGDLHFEHTYHKKDIIKHSKNIIDLIEVGDYVNGSKVIEVDNYKGAMREVYLEGQNPEKDCGIYFEQLETILTKEQYEQNSYKI